ncbi:hypothetical protein QLX08_002900 [Tetragonisca angustula]|uniref:Condensin complex subunit 2 n=1 Tax=Tetragonisca angustula TaxID=166442 RepID=A0AAW1A8Y7_9HYME
MATRASMPNVLIDPGIINSTPVSSSPLRRKSVIPQRSNNFTLLENDDEAERLARRRQISDMSSMTSKGSNDKRHSLGFGLLVHMPASQMAEHISQCIKLGTENKINAKNAFSLEMIDFMTYMIKKKDANMSNLQVASTSLDVSTKIYGFRVDGVHTDILKMISGMEKQHKDNENQNNLEEMDCQEAAENIQDGINQMIQKKKKKNKQKIFTTVEALKINVDTEKPSLITMEADLQTTDMLYQAMLPNHANSKFYPHRYNDILVDTVKNKVRQDEDTAFKIPEITDFSNMEICPSLFYFDFHSWTINESNNDESPKQNNESRFQFDLDASLVHEDEHVSTGMNYFDIEMTEEENVDRCAMVPNQVENIVDVCKVLTNTVSTKVSEYSFIQKMNIHWAGPSHWKATNLKNSLYNNKLRNQLCRQSEEKERNKLQLSYDNETIKNVNAKFLPSQSINMHTRTAKMEWNEEILTLPPDVHYDIIQAYKLYHHTLKLNLTNLTNTNVTSSRDDAENCNYTNENDVSSHSLDDHSEGCQQSERNDTNDNNTQYEDQNNLGMPFTGKNLVAAPKLTNKQSIAYCIRPKKIDMKQLKYSIWECLKRTMLEDMQEDARKRRKIEENVQRDKDKMNDKKYFSHVYKALPNLLTKTNIEALSFPISFVSLLHLANEKTLKINSSCDIADIIIEQD